LIAPPPKLADLGINKTQSSRWQRLATLDRDVFEGKVKAAAERGYNAMTSRLVKAEQIKQAKARHGKIIERGCTVDDLVALAESGKHFSVICADPAWPWKPWSPLGGTQSSVDHHYGTSEIDEIKALPVAPLAANGCVLFLWGTWPWLPQVIEIISAWGFTYKTCAFVWVKQTADRTGLHTGMGYFTRSNSEICLLATKGSPQRLAADVHQVVLAPVGEHSAKPEEVRGRIERLFGGPYLELYARKPAPGWTTWGNEIARDHFIFEAAE
jgi:N6-adenosine-specific RNA methylase IME4